MKKSAKIALILFGVSLLPIWRRAGGWPGENFWQIATGPETPHVPVQQAIAEARAAYGRICVGDKAQLGWRWGHKTDIGFVEYMWEHTNFSPTAVQLIPKEYYEVAFRNECGR